jgi:small conductance mechanosensitive channel
VSGSPNNCEKAQGEVQDGGVGYGSGCHFAGGVFLVILQPFKVGDFVTVAGVTGTVEEIGLFATIINTPDNVKTMVGNGKVLADTIQNFSANPYRRVELTAQLAHGVDPAVAVALLKPALAKLANVIADPAPDVEILTFNPMGAVLAVSPYCTGKCISTRTD